MKYTISKLNLGAIQLFFNDFMKFNIKPNDSYKKSNLISISCLKIKFLKLHFLFFSYSYAQQFKKIFIFKNTRTMQLTDQPRHDNVFGSPLTSILSWKTFYGICAIRLLLNVFDNRTKACNLQAWRPMTPDNELLELPQWLLYTT